MKRLLIGCCLLAFGTWETRLGAQPDIDVCSAPGTIIADGVVTTDSLTVTDSIAILDLNVSVDATVGFLGDFIISITSAAGTTVELLAANGGSTTALEVTFDDQGVAQPPASGYACACPVAPNEILNSVAGELSDGLWTLTLEDTFVGSPTGILNEWCVLASALAPVESVDALSCSDGEGGTIAYSGIAGSDYASVDIFVNGTLDTTVGPYLAGGAIAGVTSISYSTTQTVELCLVPTGTNGSLGLEACCLVLVLEAVDAEACDAPAILFDGPLLGVDTLLTVSILDALTISEVEVSLDVTTTFVPLRANHVGSVRASHVI